MSTGQAVPDLAGKVFAWFGAVATTADRVLFVAGVDGDTVPPGLFLWTHGKLARVRTDATDAGPVADPFVFAGPVALGGRNVAVLERTVGRR